MTNQVIIKPRVEKENPCKSIGTLGDLFVQRDHCFCPGHGVYKAPHTRCLGGAITFLEGKGYRSGLCDECMAKGRAG